MAEETKAAQAADLPVVREVVQEAYGPWAESLGFRPGPMDADYAELIAAGKVYLTGRDGVDGIVVLAAEEDCLLVENVAVRPGVQGRGVGRALLAFAEREAARRALPALRLYTHERMASNIGLYRRLGYTETGRERVPAGELVHMRKELRTSEPAA